MQHTVKAIMQMSFPSISDYFECFSRESPPSVIERQIGEMISLEEHLATSLWREKISEKKKLRRRWKIAQSTSRVDYAEKLNLSSTTRLQVHDINLFSICQRFSAEKNVNTPSLNVRESLGGTSLHVISSSELEVVMQIWSYNEIFIFFTENTEIFILRRSFLASWRFCCNFHHEDDEDARHDLSSTLSFSLLQLLAAKLRKAFDL